MDQYKCKHFKIHELVDPETYRLKGEKAWELMDERILEALDSLRDRYGPATVNNYEYGGDRKWSGLRTSDSPWYSKYSQHSFGRAVDVIFSETSAQEVRDYIRKCEADRNWFSRQISNIRAIEKDVSWLHIDCRNCDPIKWFSP